MKFIKRPTGTKFVKSGTGLKFVKSGITGQGLPGSLPGSAPMLSTGS